MGGAFNIIMKLVSNVIGLLIMFLGLVWIGQGLHVGPDTIMRGFMVGDRQWSLYGAGLVILGVCHLIWTNTRQDDV